VACIAVAATPSRAVLADRPRFAVIAHTADLLEPAKAWRDYRRSQGWEIALVAAPRDATAESLHTAIHALVAARPVDENELTAVLLLGDVGTDAIPTFYFDQPDPVLLPGGEAQFASDHPYALPDPKDERRMIAVGRVAVATPDEAMRVLAKIRRYEQEAPAGPWRRRINYVAGEGRFGDFDALLESLFRAFLDTFVPDTFDITLTYAKADSPWCPPPSQLEETALARLSEAALLFNYVGHGHAQGVDTLRWSIDGAARKTAILRGAALERLPACDGRIPLALMSCCSTGWFDLADHQGRRRDCIAETMLKHSDGPIAVIAGTRPTHPYGNALMQKEFTRELIAHPELPLGEIDRRARRAMLRTDRSDRRLDSIARPIAALTRWHSSLEELQLMHVRMYVLLGDPMLRVAAPGAAMSSLRVDGGALEGHVDHMQSGTVTVTIETARGDSARAAELQAAVAGDDLEARAAHNYPIANARVLWHGTGDVRDGAFRVRLPTSFADNARILRVHATGTDATQRSMDATAVLRRVQGNWK